MAFWKADQLLSLAVMAAGQSAGVTLDDVVARFNVSRRTAQRMLHTLEWQFPDVVTAIDGDGRKRWRLPAAPLRDLMTLAPEELAALDLAVENLKGTSLSVEAEHLLKLREKIMALVPRSKAARLETDHEALLEAQGLAARPGPRQRIDPKISVAIAEAIKAGRVLEVAYRSRTSSTTRDHRLAPYGLITGIRRYLVARIEGDHNGPLRLFVVERIYGAIVTAVPFVRDPDFDLQAFAHCSFGVFQDPNEFAEVVWRFSPAAAERARGFEFHPSQVVEDQPDGSLIVRFWASGHLEMAWHLYMWGDAVEVLKPPELRDLVAGYQRSDFPSLP